MWKQSETGSFYSEHHLTKYLGDLIPKYHVVEESNEWMIGIFYGYTGEYVPLDEVIDDYQLRFSTPGEAKTHVDIVLEGLK